MLQQLCRLSLKATTCLPRFSPALIRHTSFYDPDYLEALKPKIPIYDALNIQMRGYDYVVLESYQRFVHKTVRNMELDVEDAWATPATVSQVLKYKPQSAIAEAEYTLKLYERNVQVTDVPTTTLAVLLRVLEASLPEGVMLRVHPHEDEHEEIRYVPDKELIELKSQLEGMAAQKKK